MPLPLQDRRSMDVESYYLCPDKFRPQNTNDWRRFQNRYAVYHFYRQNDLWEPRSGLGFGVDYVLYRAKQVARSHEHSQKMVKIVAAYEPLPRWLDIISLLRISHTVNKKLVLAFVHQDTENPRSRFCVSEVEFSRWDPNDDR